MPVLLAKQEMVNNIHSTNTEENVSINANGLCDTIEVVLFTKPIPLNEPVENCLRLILQKAAYYPKYIVSYLYLWCVSLSGSRTV